MAAINSTNSPVMALHKYYHTDDSKFYSATASVDYADELFAVTFHTTTTSQTIIRFIKTADGTWWKKEMLDANTDAIILIDGGSAIGTFERLNDKVYYSNYENNVLQLRPRRSAGDTDADYIYKAGLPDPNAIRVIDRAEETAGWTLNVGGGAGDSEIDRSPLHRLQGKASLMFSQETDGQTSTLNFNSDDIIDCSTFEDGTNSDDSDFIAFELFRFNKRAISEIVFYISSGEFTNNFFSIPITVTSDLTNEDGTTWDSYHYHQTTTMAEWAMNFHDNQMFRVRLRKSWFEITNTTGAPNWDNIKKIAFTLKANSNATANNPAKIAIDNVRLLRTPPKGAPYKIQISSCERQESGSASGWEKIQGSTPCDFNSQLAREGVWCVVVSAKANAAGTATATINFSPAKDFATFPDGTTATTSDVLKLNCAWKGFGLLPGFQWSDLASPRIRFEDTVTGFYRTVQFGILENLAGGGTESQVQWNTESGDDLISARAWSAAVTTRPDFTAIDKISIFGPFLDDVTDVTSYYIDDIRIERPEAMMPVNIFEPVELMILDAISEFIVPKLKDFGWLVELALDVGAWIFSELNYQTYGMGHIRYPDYEHSSIGLAGLTLTSYGSKKFGIMLKSPPHDLLNFKILTFLPFGAWEFDPENGKWGFFQLTSIPAGPNDKFSIWMASPDAKTIKDVVIKFHANTGVEDAPDRGNYWEYTIPGMQIAGKLRDQELKDKETGSFWKALKNADIDDVKRGDLATFAGRNNPQNASEVKDFITDTIKFLGKDRGGWPSATFEWSRSDMILVRNNEAGSPSMANIAGHTIEVSSVAGNATICVDNLIMIKEGALTGKYYYKVVLEDDEGYLSNSSEPSLPIRVDKKDAVLTNIYVPNTNELKRIKNKRIYRIGGISTEWLHVGDMLPNKTTFYDNVPERNLGLILPDDAYGPPKAKVMKRIGNNMYYGNVEDRFQNKIPYRLYKSEAFIAFRVSDFSCIDIPETKGSGITGIAEYYGHIAVWTSDSLWTTTQALNTPVFRSHRGCVAKRSIAVSDYGLIWLSRAGLMMGNISQVDEKFFLPINPLFETYTEKQLSNAVGVVIGIYYYLFYDSSNKKGVVCNLVDRTFSELTGNAFDVMSLSLWDGRDDTDNLYYGRSNGTIFEMFNGTTDNGTAINTVLRTKDFTFPGLQFEKHLKAFYLAGAKLTSTNANVTVAGYANQATLNDMGTITFASTAVKSFVDKTPQGTFGSHMGIKLIGTNRHKITEMLIKIHTEADTETMQ